MNTEWSHYSALEFILFCLSQNLMHSTQMSLELGKIKCTSPIFLFSEFLET